VGVIGSGLGASLALAFGALQSRYAFIRLPQDAYYLDRAPVEVVALDVVVTVIATILICTLAAYLPARAASRVEPIRTIRFGG